MRDPGLFGGLESTTPPSSMAIRLHQSLVTLVTEFLLRLWGDEQFEETSALQITEWAIEEMLPSPPVVLDKKTQGSLTSQIGRTAISLGLVSTSNSNSIERLNRGLRAIADKLGIDNEDYLSHVMAIIDD